MASEHLNGQGNGAAADAMPAVPGPTPQQRKVQAAIAAQRRVHAKLDEARRQVVELEREAGEAQVRVNEAVADNATAADGWLNYKQAAEYLSMSRSAVRCAVDDGKLPSYGEGIVRRFWRAELDAAVREGRLNGGSRS